MRGVLLLLVVVDLMLFQQREGCKLDITVNLLMFSCCLNIVYHSLYKSVVVSRIMCGLEGCRKRTVWLSRVNDSSQLIRPRR